MSCDKGYQGDCCCECDNLLELKDSYEVFLLSKGKIDRGFVCIGFRENSDHIKDRYIGHYKDREHGSCELFQRRKSNDKL